MNFKLNKNIKESNVLVKSFNELAVKTFELSFEKWMNDGYWTDKYIPYIFAQGDRVIANASANIIDTLWQGKARRYVQIGTVMTEIEYRNGGLSRQLIQTITEDWKDSCDAIYLFANDTVLDFYPKLGFQQETEYQCIMEAFPKPGKVRKLNMAKSEDRDKLAKYYSKSNPFSALPMVDNYGLLMFYCSAFMKDCVYYCEDFDAVVVAQKDGENLFCLDVYCDNNNNMTDIVSAIAGEETKRIVLGFTPKDNINCRLIAVEGDDTLFILKSKENIFSKNKLMFPALSHA